MANDLLNILGNIGKGIGKGAKAVGRGVGTVGDRIANPVENPVYNDPRQAVIGQLLQEASANVENPVMSGLLGFARGRNLSQMARANQGAQQTVGIARKNALESIKEAMVVGGGIQGKGVREEILSIMGAYQEIAAENGIDVDMLKGPLAQFTSKLFSGGGTGIDQLKLQREQVGLESDRTKLQQLQQGGSPIDQLKTEKAGADLAFIRGGELTPAQSRARSLSEKGKGSTPLQPEEAKSIAEEIMNPQSFLRVDDLSTKNRSIVSKELTKLKKQASINDDVLGIALSSAGGKSVSDTVLQSMAKAQLVLFQVDELKKEFANDDSILKDFAPITKLIRSNNPLDVSAKKITALLTSLVPNLARGVYGEVGVLTDNDIRLYRNTLANLGNVEEVRQALMAMTSRIVQRSVESTIKTQAMGGRDVSAFGPLLDSLSKRSREFESPFRGGGGKVNGPSEEAVNTKVRKYGKEKVMAGLLADQIDVTQYEIFQ
jgi:hypothetical protein